MADRKTLLTIAGFDPSSGAGMTADLQVFAAHDCFGISAITAITVQSTLGVRGVHPTDSSILTAQLICLTADMPPAGIKIGMLATEANVLAVTDFLGRYRQLHPVPVVLDPVMLSSSGLPLLSDSGVAALRERLLPQVTVVTPNRMELGRLMNRELQGTDQTGAAAREFADQFGGLTVIATAGDEKAPDDLVAGPDGSLAWLRGTQIESRATHGTGCAFSSALLCHLAAGLEPLESARRAKRFVEQAILRAEPRGSGKGPMHLLWPLRSRLP